MYYYNYQQASHHLKYPLIYWDSLPIVVSTIIEKHITNPFQENF